MVDINKIVEFATGKGYKIADLYRKLGLTKAGFQNLRKNKNKFSIQYFYELCEFLRVEPSVALKIFDENNSENLGDYLIEEDSKVLDGREVQIEKLIKYAHSKRIYIKDICECIAIEKEQFKDMRKSNKEALKPYFFEICDLLRLPHEKAVTKYTIRK